MAKDVKRLIEEQKKAEKMEADRKNERLLDMWRIYWKLKKFNQAGTGNLALDRQIINVCGKWNRLANITGVRYELDVDVIDKIYEDIVKLGIDYMDYQEIFNLARKCSENPSGTDNPLIRLMMTKYNWAPAKIIRHR